MVILLWDICDSDTMPFADALMITVASSLSTETVTSPEFVQESMNMLVWVLGAVLPMIPPA